MNLRAVLVGLAGAVALALVGRRLSSGSSSSSASSPGGTQGIQFIQAKGYGAGSPGRRVDWIVLHTTDPPHGDPLAAGGARATAGYFAAGSPDATGRPQDTSSHLVVGPEEAIQCVRYDDVAYHARGANPTSIGVELTARAAFTGADWMDARAEAMLERAADLVADIASTRNVPLEFVDAAGLLRGARGLTTHAQVALAFKQTTHTDPGVNFPLEHFIDLVRARTPVA